MKILCVTNLYPPYVLGGYELLAEKTMTAFSESGCEVFVATGCGKGFERKPNVFGIYNLNLDQIDREFYIQASGFRQRLYRQVYSHYNYTATRKLIEKLHPDVVSFWNLGNLTVAPVIAAQHKKVPTILHVSDEWLLHNFSHHINKLFPCKGKTAKLQLFIRASLRRLLYFSTRPQTIIIPSESLKRTYTAANFGFPDHIFHIIPHGIDTRIFRKRDTYYLSNNVVRLLFVGQLWEGKGAQVLIQALHHLVKQDITGWSLDIYGKGSLEFTEYLQQMIIKCGLESYIFLRGTVPYQDLPSVYYTHDILVFPSIWNEPFALVPLEAMATGMPVIGTDVGGTSEAINDKITGLIVPANDAKSLAEAIKNLLDDSELRATLGKKAANVAQDVFSQERMFASLLSIYKEAQKNRSECV